MRPAVCRLPVEPDPAGTIGAGWGWDVVAAAPGVYEISARVDPDEPDPKQADSSDVFRFEVLPGSGGSGGGGSGPYARPRAR